MGLGGWGLDATTSGQGPASAGRLVGCDQCRQPCVEWLSTRVQAPFGIGTSKVRRQPALEAGAGRATAARASVTTCSVRSAMFRCSQRDASASSTSCRAGLYRSREGDRCLLADGASRTWPSMRQPVNNGPSSATPKLPKFEVSSISVLSSVLAWPEDPVSAIVGRYWSLRDADLRVGGDQVPARRDERRVAAPARRPGRPAGIFGIDRSASVPARAIGPGCVRQSREPVLQGRDLAQLFRHFGLAVVQLDLGLQHQQLAAATGKAGSQRARRTRAGWRSSRAATTARGRAKANVRSRR